MAKSLTKKKVEGALAKLQFNWHTEDNALLIEIEVTDFSSGVWVINEIADVAKEVNHHPDLKLENYNQLTIRLATHDAGGITEKDLALAEKIDAILSRAITTKATNK